MALLIGNNVNGIAHISNHRFMHGVEFASVLWPPENKRTGPADVLHAVDGFRRAVLQRRPSLCILTGRKATMLLVTYLIPSCAQADHNNVFVDGDLKPASELRWAGKVFPETYLGVPVMVFPVHSSDAVIQTCLSIARTHIKTPTLCPLPPVWQLPVHRPIQACTQLKLDATLVSVRGDGAGLRLIVLEEGGTLLELIVSPFTCVDMYLECENKDVRDLEVFLSSRAHYIKKGDINPAGPGVVAFDYPNTTKIVYCISVPIIHYPSAARNLVAIAWVEPVEQAYLLTNQLAIGRQVAVACNTSHVNARGRVVAELTTIVRIVGTPRVNHDSVFLVPVFSHRPELRMVGFLVFPTTTCVATCYCINVPLIQNSLGQFAYVTINGNATTLEDAFLTTLASFSPYHVFIPQRDTVFSLLSRTGTTNALKGICCFDVPGVAPIFTASRENLHDLITGIYTEVHQNITTGTFRTELGNTYAKCQQVGLVSPELIVGGVSNFFLLRAVMQHVLMSIRNQRLLIRQTPPVQDRPVDLNVHEGGYIGVGITGMIPTITHQFDYTSNYASIVVAGNMCPTSFVGFGTNGRGVFNPPDVTGCAPLALVFKTLIDAREDAQKVQSTQAIANAAKELTVICYGCIKSTYRWIGDAITARGYEQLEALVSHFKRPVFWHTDGVQAIMSDDDADQFVQVHGKPSAEAGAVLVLKTKERFTRFLCIEAGLSAGAHMVDGKLEIVYRGTHNKHKSECKLVQDVAESVIRILLAYTVLRADFIVTKVMALLTPMLTRQGTFENLHFTHELTGTWISGKEPHHHVMQRLFTAALAGCPVVFPCKSVKYVVCNGRHYALCDEFDSPNVDLAWYVKRVFGVVARYLKFVDADTLQDKIIAPLSKMVADKTRICLQDIGSAPVMEWTQVCVLCEVIKKATDGPCTCGNKLWPKTFGKV